MPWGERDPDTDEVERGVTDADVLALWVLICVFSLCAAFALAALLRVR